MITSGGQATSMPPRPRQVTLAGMQAIVGSVLALVAFVATMQQINSSAMTDVLRDVLDAPQAAQLGLTLESLRTLMKYTIMVLAVVSATTLVLGFYVLRRHRAARIVLSVVGVLVVLVTVVAGPTGWAVTLYVGVSVGLLWSGPARAWFAPDAGTQPRR